MTDIAPFIQQSLAYNIFETSLCLLSVSYLIYLVKIVLDDDETQAP
ncbi:MAG: hypothetical protein OXE99_01705 [Cellvibrionales bacterium]|nr:hypothetical protein [Cellvibrionales bacterium]